MAGNRQTKGQYYSWKRRKKEEIVTGKSSAGDKGEAQVDCIESCGPKIEKVSKEVRGGGAGRIEQEVGCVRLGL